MRLPTFSLPDVTGTPIDYKLLFVFQFLGLDPNTYKGFYIEAGANDGITQSNTALLERRYGWKGLLVEPSPVGYQKCLINRSAQSNTIVHSALVSFDAASKGVTSIRGDFSSGHCMSSIDGKRLSAPSYAQIDVPANTLQSLLDKNNVERVDLLSLDTEGYEYEILQGIDFNKPSAPKVCIIELYPHEIEQVKALLNEWYDFRGNFSNYNKIDHPQWDGTHNDYLFVHRSMVLPPK